MRINNLGKSTGYAAGIGLVKERNLSYFTFGGFAWRLSGDGIAFFYWACLFGGPQVINQLKSPYYVT
jgi:hypothetical protein